MQLTVFDFLNTSHILDVLSTSAGRERFKLNKAEVFSLPTKQDRVFYKTDFDKTTITCIVVTPDLFVIDCDNLYSFDEIATLLKAHNIETLTTRSPYGGHFYLRRLNGEYLPDTTVENKAVILKSFKNKFEYHLSSQILDIQFFTSDTRHNVPIFDGNNNGYYRKVSTTSKIADLTPQLFDDLVDLIRSYKSSVLETKSAVGIAGGKVFAPSKARADKIKDWLQRGSIPRQEFNTAYSKYKLDFDLSEISNRNETLHRIAMWAGRSGFLTEQEWHDFVVLMYHEHFEHLSSKSNPFTLQEVKKTILAPGKFRQCGFTEPEETLPLLEQRQQQASNETVDLINNFLASGKTKFLALDPVSPSDKDGYLFYDLRRQSTKFVARLNANSAIRLVKADKQLRDDYLLASPDPSSGAIREEINKKVCFPCPYTSSIDEASPTLFVQDDAFDVSVDFSYFRQNAKIHEILEKKRSGLFDADDITARFKQTYYYHVTEKNFFAGKSELRAKFEGDLGLFLEDSRPLVCMPIFRDDGGTGKDALLVSLLTMCMYGIPNYKRNRTPDFLLDFIVKEANYTDRITPLAPELLLGQFNSPMEARAIIFSEIGGASAPATAAKTVHAFIEKMKSYLSVPTIPLHKKGQDIVNIANNKYYAWMTNYQQEIIINKRQNRRFYVVNGLQTIDVRQPKVRKQVYEELGYDLASIDFSKEANEIWSVFEQDETAILEYLILVAPDHAKTGYSGYSTLPETAHDDDQFSNFLPTFEELANDDSSTAEMLAAEALNTFTDVTGSVDAKAVEVHAAKQTGELYPVAKIFAELCYRQLNMAEFAAFDTGTYYTVKHLSDAIMSLQSVRSLRSGSNAAITYLKTEISSRLVKSSTKTMASRLSLKQSKHKDTDTT